MPETTPPEPVVPARRTTYKVMQWNLTKNDIEKMKRMEHARPVSVLHVRELLKALLNGAKFDGVVTANDITDGRGKRFRLIDGNHRWEAAMRYLEIKENASVRVTAHVYDHLTDEEERERFIICNNSRPVKQRDRLRLFQEHIDIYRLIKEKGFPCRIDFMGRDAITYGNLFVAYLGRKMNSIPKTNLLEIIKPLGEEDYYAMRRFIEDIVTIFGKPAPGIGWFGYVGLSSLAKLYFGNLNRLSRSEIVSRIQRKVAGDSNVVQSVRLARAAGAVGGLTRLMAESLNRGISDPDRMFLLPTELNVGEPKPIPKETRIILTPEIVQKIREAAASGLSEKEIAHAWAIRPTRVRYWTDEDFRQKNLQYQIAHARRKDGGDA